MDAGQDTSSAIQIDHAVALLTRGRRGTAVD